MRCTLTLSISARWFTSTRASLPSSAMAARTFSYADDAIIMVLLDDTMPTRIQLIVEISKVSVWLATRVSTPSTIAQAGGGVRDPPAICYTYQLNQKRQRLITYSYVESCRPGTKTTHVTFSRHISGGLARHTH